MAKIKIERMLNLGAAYTPEMGEGEMRQIARWIDQAIAHADDEAALARINGEVGEMCRGFPAPGITT